MLRIIVGCVVAAVVTSPMAVADPTPEELVQYLAAMRNVNPWAGSDTELIEDGELDCYLLETKGYKATGRMMVQSGFSANQAVQMLALAKQYFCPDVVDPPFAS